MREMKRVLMRMLGTGRKWRVKGAGRGKAGSLTSEAARRLRRELEFARRLDLKCEV
jgi:hypothetical protein